MYKSFFALFMVLSLHGQAAPYPITPRPLRLLVKESPLIISGYVINVLENKKAKDHWDGTIARIAVLEKLQGKLKADTIEVAFSPNMICPAPPRYEKDTYVLAFLHQMKNGQYQTHALSYGSKTLSPEAIAIYKARILEMQQIEKINDADDRYLQTVEWLVKCAEQPDTRWEGTSELSPESDFMFYYDKDKDKEKKFSSGLTAVHKARLKKALLATTVFTYDMFGLVDIVYQGNECDVNPILLSGLKATQDNTWMAGSFMWRLQHVNATPAMKKLMAHFNDIQFESEKANEIKKCIADFIMLVEPAIIPAPDKAIAVDR